MPKAMPMSSKGSNFLMRPRYSKNSAMMIMSTCRQSLTIMKKPEVSHNRMRMLSAFSMGYP